jgi:hypothetical protein
VLGAGDGLDFAELAEDIANEVRVIKNLDVELEAIEDRIGVLYDDADPAGVERSAPGLGVHSDPWRPPDSSSATAR